MFEIIKKSNDKSEDILVVRTIAWLRNHEKQLVYTGIGISIFLIMVYGAKSKDSFEGLWKTVKERMREVKKYSPEWFESISDGVLDAERENVRENWCAAGSNLIEADRLRSLLLKFDEELSKRAWGDEIPHAPKIYREHGWYLPNKD